MLFATDSDANHEAIREIFLLLYVCWSNTPQQKKSYWSDFLSISGFFSLICGLRGGVEWQFLDKKNTPLLCVRSIQANTRMSVGLS